MIDDRVIRWRCRRGMKELDVMLERFLQRGYDTLSLEGKTTFARLLDALDPDLFHWLTGAAEPEEASLRDIVRIVRTHAEAVT